MAALDYIIKPVALDELKSALERFKAAQALEQNEDQFKLLESVVDKNPDQKMALVTSDGYIFASKTLFVVSRIKLQFFLF